MRELVGGVRFILRDDGAIRSAAELLPDGPLDVAEVPDRLGGGFLFAAGKRLWRSGDWLGPLTPWLDLGSDAAKLFVGLDRIYAIRGSWVIALDPRSGAIVDRGPLPDSPKVSQVTSLDAWRAAAIGDFRGAVATFDAGATWTNISIPVDPVSLATLDDAIAIHGADDSWWRIEPDGKYARLTSGPVATGTPMVGRDGDLSGSTRGVPSIATAIADGWPLSDHEAMVARDGSAFVVSRSDGRLLKRYDQVFPLTPSVCHAISLSSVHDRGAFGFVCGQLHGATAIYRWERSERSMVPLGWFREPREVLGFDNGALAVRGECSERGPERGRSNAAPSWCVMWPGKRWKEVFASTEGGWLVALSDGRLTVVKPPRGGDISTLGLTLIDGDHSRDVAIQIPRLLKDTLTALSSGVWLNGFEERDPGHVGGWVDWAGSALGVEISVDGDLRVGGFLRDAGDPVVSGRWGLGWKASRTGFETMDGGMTWRTLELPTPFGVGSERACSPLGCVMNGWVRIGWGGQSVSTTQVAPAQVGFARSGAVPRLNLQCMPQGFTQQTPPHERVRRANLDGVSIDVPGESRGYPAGWISGHIQTWGGAGDRKSDPWLWRVDWNWPWQGRSSWTSSSEAPAPWKDLQEVHRLLGTSSARGSLAFWTLYESDSPGDALLVGQQHVHDFDPRIFVIREGRRPVEIVRPDGLPFGAFEGATMSGTRWIFATAQVPGEISATWLWTIENGIPRALSQLARPAIEVRSPVRLAMSSDGQSVGLIVDGQVDGASQQSPIWAVAVPLASGLVGEPERLISSRFEGTTPRICGADDEGWAVEVSYPGRVGLFVGDIEYRMDSSVVRVRLSKNSWCLERLVGLGAFGPDSTSVRSGFAPRPGLTSTGADETPGLFRTLDVQVRSGTLLSSFRCALRSP